MKMLDIALKNMCQESIDSGLNHVENIPSFTGGLPIMVTCIHKPGNTNTDFSVNQGTPTPRIK